MSRLNMWGAVVLGAVVAFAGQAAIAEPVAELEPFFKGSEKVEGTPAGNGIYTDVTFGDGEDVILAERMSITVEGDELTDLILDGVSMPDTGDGFSVTIGQVVIEDGSFPLNIDDLEEADIFEWILNMDAERMALSELQINDEDFEMTLASLTSGLVEAGRFSNITMQGLNASGTGDDDQSFAFSMDSMTVEGIGAAWAIYARNTELDAGLSEGLGDSDLDFMDEFSLSEYRDHLRLEGWSFAGLTFSVENQRVFQLDQMDQIITDYVDDFPVAGTSAFSGAFNVEGMRALADDAQTSVGLQAFQLAYGDASVIYTGESRNEWNEQTTSVDSATTIELDRLLRLGLSFTMNNYNPALLLAAVNDPTDSLTYHSVMEGVTATEAVLSLSDLGALDIGFSLAPASIERETIAMQAAQISGFGVVQAMQMGVKISGSVAETISSFIRSGGTVTIEQNEGSSIPVGKAMAMTPETDVEALAPEFLGSLDLNVSHAP